MNNLFAIMAYLAIGLLLGTFFSEHIYADMSLTDWNNVWTWGWIILWPFFLAFQFFVIFMIFCAVAGVTMICYFAGQDRGWW